MYENIGDWASGIYVGLGSPSGITPAYISGWLVNNVGYLNIAIATDYSGISGDIVPPLGQEEQAIYTSLFGTKYYELKISSSLDAASWDTWSEIQDEGSRVKRVTKNDLVASYTKNLQAAQLSLNDLINKYRMNHSTPNQVVGDDTVQEVLPVVYDYRT